MHTILHTCVPHNTAHYLKGPQGGPTERPDGEGPQRRLIERANSLVNSIEKNSKGRGHTHTATDRRILRRQELVILGAKSLNK